MNSTLTCLEGTGVLQGESQNRELVGGAPSQEVKQDKKLEGRRDWFM